MTTKSTRLPLENIHVDMHSRTHAAAIACDYKGARYHIWREPSGTLQDTLYKNPPLSVKAGAPGDFQPRKLRVDSATSSAIIATMLEAVERDGLMAKALERLEAEECAQREELERARRDDLIRDAAQDLFAACCTLIRTDNLQLAIDQARAAIVKAEGGAA